MHPLLKSSPAKQMGIRRAGIEETNILIVGAGIAGLYTAYLLSGRDPTAKIVILEKADSEGGRMCTLAIGGPSVVTGAGIGRQSKDRLLQTLVKELGVVATPFPVTFQYMDKPVSLRAQIKRLRNALRDNPERAHHMTFEAFAKPIVTDYPEFVRTMGFTDFEKASAAETIRHYGLEDAIGGWTGLRISWDAVIRALLHILRQRGVRIQTRTEVYSIHSDPNRVECLYRGKRRQTWQFKDSLICATSVGALHHWFPSVYTHLRAQPFMRIYAQFSKDTRAIIAAAVPTQTIVSGPLQKLSPMNPDKAIYMIAYADNHNATVLHEIIRKADSITVLENMVETALGLSESVSILKTRYVFWKEGTHYYTPGFVRDSRMQNPLPHVYVVGEAVSVHQGWVEGALESVRAIENLLMK